MFVRKKPNKSGLVSIQIIDKSSGKYVVRQQKGDERLIISYKEERAHKDAYNRKRGLEKLEKNLKSGKLTKKQITNKGYNKYLKMEGDINVVIDYQKYQDDAKWDGLKDTLPIRNYPKKM